MLEIFHSSFLLWMIFLPTIFSLLFEKLKVCTFMKTRELPLGPSLSCLSLLTFSSSSLLSDVCTWLRILLPDLPRPDAQGIQFHINDSSRRLVLSLSLLSHLWCLVAGEEITAVWSHHQAKMRCFLYYHSSLSFHLIFSPKWVSYWSLSLASFLGNILLSVSQTLPGLSALLLWLISSSFFLTMAWTLGDPALNHSFIQSSNIDWAAGILIDTGDMDQFSVLLEAIDEQFSALWNGRWARQ